MTDTTFEKMPDADTRPPAVTSGVAPADTVEAGDDVWRAANPSGGSWVNAATARVASLVATDPGFLDEITHDWSDAARDRSDGIDRAARIDEAARRIRDLIDWWDSEMDEPEFDAAVATADDVDLDEVARAAVTWAEQRQAKEQATWGTIDTAETAKHLERRDVLKVLAFDKEAIATGGDVDVDALVRFMEREIESWPLRPGEWPWSRAHSTARQADLREIAETFLRWTDTGAVSSWEALSF